MSKDKVEVDTMLFNNFDDDCSDCVVREVKVSRIDKEIKEESVDKEQIEDIVKETEEECKRDNMKDLKEEIKKDESKARAFIGQCKDYLTSNEFNHKCYTLSKLYNVDEKKLAETFAQKVLGTIADTLGIVIKVAYNSVRFLITLLGKLLSSTCGVVFSIAVKLTSFFTLGYTCVA